jgi:hypothetical protein
MEADVKNAASAARDSLRANCKAVLRYDKRTRMHIAYTPGLKLYVQAPTPNRAKQTLEGALALFVTAAQKNRALAAMLP